MVKIFGGNFKMMAIRIAVAYALAVASSTSVGAQSFLGGFAPEASKERKAETAKMNDRQTRKISLPDKPNKTDDHGRKQGEWASKYPNGRYKYTATFRDGKPVGKVTRFDMRGRKTVVLSYRNASDTVAAVFYHPNGKVQARGQYVNDKREGFWRMYAEDGILVESAIYSKNKLHGKRCFYFSNGELLSMCTWVDSVREGPYIKYFPSGAKEIEANFHNDELDGKFKSWGADGKLTSDGTYRSGVTVGKWHLRYPDANVEGDIVYDSHGIVVNKEEADSLMIRRNSYYNSQVGKFKDPQDFMDNPEKFFAK
ncbi:MAG: toxin-antitoxin system YwqK family antitoxin [Marinilabiliaceae bacterium]